MESFSYALISETSFRLGGFTFLRPTNVFPQTTTSVYDLYEKVWATREFHSYLRENWKYDKKW